MQNSKLRMTLVPVGWMLGGVALALGLTYGLSRNSSNLPLAPLALPSSQQAQNLDAPAPTSEFPRLAAAHYFGRDWPKNFIAGFRREHVAEDFAQLREDGFNSVILLVSWGDFQPQIEPCCRDDERAYERLRFLLDAARNAGLKVVLRIGYGWSFHPDVPSSHHRLHLLTNSAAVRQSFMRFVERIARELGDHPQVQLSFMSWEDQTLQRIEPEARVDFERFLSTLPERERNQLGLDAATPVSEVPLPTRGGTDAALFHRYWDWLKRDQLYVPAQQRLPAMSYEVRVDKEPAPGDKPGEYRWIGHEASYELPGAAVLTVYWAPYWGAQNQGEKLSAEDSARLFGGMLKSVRAVEAQKPIFIDQFNVIDNTPGHEHNASLRPDALPAFLPLAHCLMRAHRVPAYALWTWREYGESPLANPSFGYGLESWESQGAVKLEALPGGDFEAVLGPQSELVQAIPAERGRMPGIRGEDTEVCVDAVAEAGSVLSVSVLGMHEPRVLRFAQDGRQRACVAVARATDPTGQRLRLIAGAKTIRLRNVQYVDHWQAGGVRDPAGQPGPYLQAFQRFNREFLQERAPARCEAG